MQFSTSMNILNFADDTLFYMTFKTKLDMEIKLNSELTKISNWLNYNHLKLNTSKTKYMVFSPNSNIWRDLSLRISIGECLLERVYEYKYLGLIIDTKLTWVPHIKYLSSQLSKTLGIMYRTRHYLNLQSLYLIFHSLFLSKIKYGILCWARASKTTLHPLIILFNRAIRCIHFCHNQENITHLLFKNGLIHIEDIFKLELGKFMFNYSKGFLPRNFNKYFTKTNTVHNYNTRQCNNNFFLPRKNKSKGQKSLSYLGPKLWSEIPDCLKNYHKISTFNFNYKKLLLNQYRAVE